MEKPFKSETVLPPFKKATKESPNAEIISQAANTNEYPFFELAVNQAAPIGFKIFFAGGNAAAIQYHDIISPLLFDGAGEIELKTPALSIKIMGKNLRVLFDHFFENRVVWIKEPDSSFVQLSEDQPEITTITLVYKE